MSPFYILAVYQSNSHKHGNGSKIIYSKTHTGVNKNVFLQEVYFKIDEVHVGCYVLMHFVLY